MSLPFKILCPDGVITDDTAGMVVIPALEGDMGVMQRHSAMIVQLKRGTVTVFSDGQKASSRFYVDGGIAHITPDELMILSDMACNLEGLDESSLSDDEAHAERIEAQLYALKNLAYS